MLESITYKYKACWYKIIKNVVFINDLHEQNRLDESWNYVLKEHHDLREQIKIGKSLIIDFLNILYTRGEGFQTLDLYEPPIPNHMKNIFDCDIIIQE